MPNQLPDNLFVVPIVMDSGSRHIRQMNRDSFLIMV